MEARQAERPATTCNGSRTTPGLRVLAADPPGGTPSPFFFSASARSSRFFPSSRVFADIATKRWGILSGVWLARLHDVARFLCQEPQQQQQQLGPKIIIIIAVIIGDGPTAAAALNSKIKGSSTLSCVRRSARFPPPATSLWKALNFARSFLLHKLLFLLSLPFCSFSVFV